jgi:hypothetical protein
VAGAYSDKDYLKVFENMRKGIQLSIKVLSLGFAPFCPWLDYHYPFFGMPKLSEIQKEMSGLCEDERKQIELDEITMAALQDYSLSWLEVSDALIVREQWENSNGTKHEIECAKQLGIPVFFTLVDLVIYFMNKEKKVEGMFVKFVDLVRDQWEYGGKKYKLSDSNARESTDVLFDKHGKNWLFGTIDKYTFRFKNLARERDLLKISCYMYILWLKRGFFLEEDTSVPVDTNLENKSAHYGKFIEAYGNYEYQQLDGKSIDDISEMLGHFSEIMWAGIKEQEIFDVFHMSYNIWKEKFADVTEHDTDTFNEERQKD